MKKTLCCFLLIFALALSGCVLPVPPAEAESQAQPVPAGGVPEDLLTVHFIDVGQADCALIECGGQFLLIDGGNVGDGRLVVAYLQEQGVEELAAVICTHAHEDHVGGLASVLAVFPADLVMAPTRTHSSRCFEDFVYYVDQQQLELTIPEPGDSFSLGSATVSILGPVQSYPDLNNTSIVCRLDHGQNSFLFTGDMETLAENDILDAGAQVDVDVLKVGHHGSYTSTGYRLLYEASPDYGIISLGADNPYGYPHWEPLLRLEQAGVTVFRTDTLGTIRAVSDGESLEFFWQNQKTEPLYAEKDGTLYFIGNRNSRIFHGPGCENLPSERNQVFFDSYDEAVAAGFTPCGGCMGE